jgi:hypothetical protein
MRDCFENGNGLSGKIDVSGGTNNVLMLSDFPISVSSGDHITITGTLNVATSWFKNVWDWGTATNDDFKPIRIGGTNKTDLIERPYSSQQHLYVGKHGSDSYTGHTPAQAFLTIGAAITAAGTPGSESTAVTIHVLDDGEYTEDITGVAWVNIWAPNARSVTVANGGHSIATNSRWVFGSMHAVGDFAVQKTSSGYSYLKIGKLTRVGGNNRPIDAYNGTLEVDIDYVTGICGVVGARAQNGDTKVIGRIGHCSFTSGTGAALYASALSTYNAETDVTVERIEFATGVAGIAFAVLTITSSDAILRAKFGTVIGDSATAFNVNQASTGLGAIYAEGERLDTSVAYTVTANSTFRLLVADLVGTETAADGADVRVTKAKRDNYTATTDPTANDDSTDGYTIGSVWINTSTDRIWVCVDATATAAIWNVVPDGGEVQLQTTDATVTTAVTIPLVDPETVSAHVYIAARRTDAVDAAAYERRAAFYRNGGSATRITFVDTPFTRETDATWNVDVVASGNNALIQVKGAASQTIEWRVRYTLERM